MSAGAEDPPQPGITGRAAEHSALRGLLARAPLVTVTGPAKVGKSTLARAVLEEAAWHDGRPGGFVRVDCRENVAEDGVTAALNRAAGLPYDTPPQTLAAHCARHGLTVLLDDCDPVADACAWLVRQLLRAGTVGVGVGHGRS
ncbi:ATP-binding protein, partial [Streptomyces rimosus]|uniref:ATP-binding protein n=1 Tax=Streptomyces rimosus TaxID=1927 RepID=UPI0004C7DBD1